MAGTRASTKKAATASEPSDGMDSTPAPKGKSFTRRGKGSKVAALKRSSAQGRGGSTTSSPNSSAAGSRSGSTVASREDTRKFNELQRLKKRKALADQAKEDAAIQKRTRAMMEAEQNEDNNENQHADEDDNNNMNGSSGSISDNNNDVDNHTHKRQKTRSEDLDPQEQAYADEFDKDDNNISNLGYSDLPDQAENRDPVFDEDDECHNNAIGGNSWNDADHVFGGGENNGITIDDEDSSDSNLETTPSTPYRPRGSARQNLTYKVVEDDFSPKTLRLAIKGKNFLRKYIATESPFPPTVPVDLKDKFVSSILQEAAEGNEVLQTSLKRLDDKTRVLLTTFIWYARGGMLSSLISKARSQVPSLYGVTGHGLSQDDIKLKVSWLLDDGNFKFGGINWTGNDMTSTVDFGEPFGHLAFVELIRDQWFANTKGEIEAFRLMVAKETILAPVLILVVCAVEHVLREYANGKKMPQSFNSATLKIRYSHHLNSWKILETRSKTWAKAKLSKMYKTIIKSTHMEFMLNGNGDGSGDLKQVDFEALEQSAIEGMD